MTRISMVVALLLAAGCGRNTSADPCFARLCARASDGSGTVEVESCDRSGPERYCATASGSWSCMWAVDSSPAPADDFECAGL